MKLMTFFIALFTCVALSAQEPRPESLWKASGKVTDPEGRPMAGVEVWASTGRGTLRRSGVATTGEDGRYELRFGPKGILSKKEATGLVAAAIGAHKLGFFEENLNRRAIAPPPTANPPTNRSRPGTAARIASSSRASRWS